MIENLEILSAAISDVGYWKWWVAKLPQAFQIEFGGVLLWSPPQEEGHPPGGIFALRFKEPVSVSFLDFSTDLPADWIQQFHDDKLEPFTVEYGSFGFNQETLISDLLKKAVKVTQFHGVEINSQEWVKAKLKLGFAAHEVGLIVAGDSVDLYTSRGSVSLDEVKEMSKKWWVYWQEYRRLRGTERALPYDYACEVIHPLVE